MSARSSTLPTRTGIAAPEINSRGPASQRSSVESAQLFDTPDPDGGIPLVHMMYYYDTYNRDFTVNDREFKGTLALYASTTFYGVTDAMWAKYRIGEFVRELEVSYHRQQSAPNAREITRPRGPR